MNYSSISIPKAIIPVPLHCFFLAVDLKRLPELLHTAQGTSQT